jgi:hypothetical protein
MAILLSAAYILFNTTMMLQCYGTPRSAVLLLDVALGGAKVMCFIK